MRSLKSLASRRAVYIYFACLFLSLHYAFTLFINSSFLSLFYTTEHINILYIIGSCITFVGLIASSSIIKRIGNYGFIFICIILEIIALLGLFLSHNPALIQYFFLAHQALPPLMLFSLDVFLEGTMNPDVNTGQIRSTYLTIMNISFLLSPLIGGFIVSTFTYRGIYITSAFFCIILLFIAIEFLREMPSRSLKEVNFIDSIRKFAPRKDLDRIFIVNLLLQIFYVLMTIYMPLYLHRYIGFSWDAIGLMFTIMLLPFVLFEAPLGRLFDKIHIEKDTLISGFIILGLSTGSMFFLHTASLAAWTIVLFITRVGASFVEVGSDYSFFRRVSERDAGFIGIFAMTLPISFIIAPLIAGPITSVLPIQYLFLLVGILMFMGTIFSYKIKTIRPKYFTRVSIRRQKKRALIAKEWVETTL